jgi:hypothetical protein
MPDTWDAGAADALLDAHELEPLDALLRHWINVARNPDAVDWVDARAEQGHVPALYHAVRNLAKGGGACGGGPFCTGSGGGRVMGSADFRRAFRLTVYMLLRAAQDVLSVAIVQGKAPNAATFALLRDKAFGWLAAQFPVARWPPLAEVLAEVSRQVSATQEPPLPAWALSASPGLMVLTMHVGAHLAFRNPSDKAIAACDKTRVPLDTERARIAATFLGMAADMSWEGLRSLEVAAFLGGAGAA